MGSLYDRLSFAWCAAAKSAAGVVSIATDGTLSCATDCIAEFHRINDVGRGGWGCARGCAVCVVCVLAVGRSARTLSLLWKMPMTAAAPSVGARVTICGLKAKPELNGKRGLVVTPLDDATGRAGIKVAGSGAVLSLKVANLELDKEPSTGAADKLKSLSLDGAKPGASPVDNGFTGLALNGQCDELKALIDAKADVNQRDTAGNTALICAAFVGHTECVRLLIDAKAWLDAAMPRAGFTALMVAHQRAASSESRSSHADCVRLLEEATRTADVLIEPIGPGVPVPTTVRLTAFGPAWPTAAPPDSSPAAVAGAGAHAPPARGTSLGVVSTMKQPQNLITWLRYHRERCGVKRFYLRLEDSPQLVPLLRQAPWKDCVRCTFIELINVQADVSRTMVRQAEFVDQMIVQARAEGEVTHLLHIDDDELLYCHGGMDALHRLLEVAPTQVSDLHLYNVEALHASPESEDPFKTCCAFRHRRSQYGAYANGKSIGSLAHPDLHANGVHHFATMSDSVLQVSCC